MTTRSPSSYYCVNITPKPDELASVYRKNRLEKSGQANSDADTNFFFNVSKASFSFSPHFHCAFFFVSCVSGAATVEKSFMNRLYQEAILMNCRICLTVRSFGQSATALTFSGSVRIPSRSIICPRYFNRSTQNLHLSGFSGRRAFLRRRNVSASNLRCSLNVLLIIIISSRYTNT